MSYSTYQASVLGRGSEIPTLNDSIESKSDYPSQNSKTPLMTYFKPDPALWVEGVSVAPEINHNSSQSSSPISQLESNVGESEKNRVFPNTKRFSIRK